VDTIRSKHNNNDDDDDDQNDMGTIWQVDPSGQLWKCQIAIVGKGARQAQGHFLEQIRKLIHNNNNNNNSTTSQTHPNIDNNNSTLELPDDQEDDVNHVLLPFLKKLSMQQATELALECIWQCANTQSGNNNKESPPPKLPPLDTLTSKVSSSSSSAVVTTIMLDGLPCHVLFLPAVSKQKGGTQH
jgi:hypothetical protein